MPVADGLSRGRLEIRGVAKSYDATPALRDVSLDVAPGEFVALLGPSGCGKTTLLRCIAGLVAVDRGDVRVDSRSLLDIAPWKRDISVVFQSYALFPHMTVEQNVAFGLRMRRLDRRRLAQRTAAALDLVHMTAYAGRLPAQLSGGQQQRVALARAIVVEPTVLLLDEPLAALDAKLRGAMQLEIRGLQRRLGVTTVLVTHDQEEAMTMSDRIAVMNDGRIEQVGAPIELYARPATPFVADFVGETNRLHGTLRLQDGAWSFLPQHAGASPLPVADGRASGPGAATMMVRPENVRLAPASAQSGGGMEAVVETTALIGDRFVVIVDAGGARWRATMLNQPAGGGPPSPGTAVRLSWRPEDAILFSGSV